MSSLTDQRGGARDRAQSTASSASSSSSSSESSVSIMSDASPGIARMLTVEEEQGMVPDASVNSSASEPPKEGAVSPKGREEAEGSPKDSKRCRRRKQTVVVARGLQGSGKSTAMRTAALLLGGLWLNQDEFRTPSKGGGNAKGKFLDKLSQCTHYGKPEYVFVDRINTQFRHRSDIYNAIAPCDGEYPEIIYIQWSHPDDTLSAGEDMSPFDPIKGRKYFDVCAKNVRNRHGKHRSIDRYADIDFILGSTAAQAEPVSNEELSQFSVAKLCDIDVTLSRREMVERILQILGKDGDFSGDDITRAMQEVARIEKNIVPVGTGKGESRRPPSELRRPQQSTSRAAATSISNNAGEPALVGRTMFQLELTTDSQRLLRRAVGKSWGYMAARGIVPKDEFHVTLLYVDSSNAFDHYSMNLVRQLWPRIGDSFAFTTAFAVCSDWGVCAAPVQFLQPVPCGNLYPHITLGVAPQASARDSNDMLQGKHPMEALRVLELELSGNQTQLELRGVLRVSE